MKTDETSRFRRKKEGKLNGWMKKRRHEGGEEGEQAKCVRLPALLSWVSSAYILYSNIYAFLCVFTLCLMTSM